MFEIDIERDFSAAHCLHGYKGNCSALHGHNWSVRVIVRAETVDNVETGNAQDIDVSNSMTAYMSAIGRVAKSQ